jgi:hypothetical protein
LGSAEPQGKALRYNINQIAARLSEAYPEELRILGGGSFPPYTGESESGRRIGLKYCRYDEREDRERIKEDAGRQGD